MAAALDDAPLVDDHDLIGIGDRRQAMRDDDGGAIGEGIGQRLLHQRFVLAVEMARGFVEHDDGRILDQHAGNGETLFFAARQSIAALADERVVAVGQCGDDVVDLRGAAGSLDLVERRLGAGVAEVGTARCRGRDEGLATPRRWRRARLPV